MLRAGKNIAFSAPTSAGKSFMVHRYIAEKIKQSSAYCAVYIVPTRALIAEVQESIRHAILEVGAKQDEFSVFVSANKLNIAEIAASSRKVFVLTQERLQEAMSNNPLTNVNLLVIDEAQNVSDESRGIIIQDAVDDLLSLNPNAQKLFIAPHIDNPAIFRAIFGIKDEILPEQTLKSPVGRNILAINFDNRMVSVSVNSYELKKATGILIIPLINAEIAERTTSNAERKAWVATHLIPKIPKPEPTIVYCDKPIDCRLAAQKIVNMREKVEISTELKTAIDFLAQQVHEDYYLCEALQNGIGYHYGKMPQFIKFYIKQLFENNDLSILCCTSTLLEGVNLPAKNIIMCHPKTGYHIDRLSVLNLAGRAGRLMEDHYGKIYCIDMKAWNIGGEIGVDVFEDKEEVVQSSVDKTIEDYLNMLLKYLENSDHYANKRVKALSTSLMMRYLKKHDRQDVANFLERSKNITPSDAKTIVDLIQSACDNLELDAAVILKNRSFDPRFQNELYLGLKGTDDYVALPFPKDDEKFRWKMKAIFCLVSVYLLRRRSKTGMYSRSWSYYGVLGANWILEQPYKEILEGKIKFMRQYEDESEKEFHNRAIESLDVDIETILKYEYTRGLKCYADIIRYIEEEKDNERKEQDSNTPDDSQPLKRSCEELPIYLEWGSFNKNNLFLMQLGLSRNVSILINEFMEHEMGSSPECLAWLEANKEELKDSIPDIFSKEIERLLEDRYKTNNITGLGP